MDAAARRNLPAKGSVAGRRARPSTTWPPSPPRTPIWSTPTIRPRSCRLPRCRLRSTPSSPTRPTRPSPLAKEAWLNARDDYGPTEAFRFYDGPIDNPDYGPEGQINAWPMDEAYVDYVDGDRRPASSTTPPATPRSPSTSSSRPTNRVARPTSRPVGTPSSSCSGVRTCPRTVPAHGRSPTTRRTPTPTRRASTCS